MADEETTEETPEETDAATEAAPEEAPEPTPEETEVPAETEAAPEPGPEAEEAPVEEAAPADAEPAAEAAAPAEDPPEQLGPKERRKRERANAAKEALPQRDADQRAAERADVRGRNAAERRRSRAKARTQDGEPGSGTPVPERNPNPAKLRQGIVVSNKADKTITVQIAQVGRHQVYEKVIRSTSTLHAHDERNEAGEGDIVRVIAARPTSKTKRWRLVEVVEKAK